MFPAKSLAWCVVAWAAMGTLARADVISNTTTWQNWTVFTFAQPPAPTPPPEAPAPAPAPTPSPAPVVAAPQFTPAAAAPGQAYDAFLNLGAGPYSDAGGLTTGGAQPWYNSSQISSFFGGQPTAQQQSDFDNNVLQRVQQAFQLAGVPITLTDNPNATTAHSLSVVSNTASSVDSKDIGLTYVGANGFSFIDQEAKSATSLDQLEWIVAHNVSHELMLAFGVGENYDQSGKFIDSKMASMAMLLDPKATFSPAAAQALLGRNFLDNSESNFNYNANAQLVEPQPVPEPATILIWAIGGTVAVLRLRGRRRNAR